MKKCIVIFMFLTSSSAFSMNRIDKDSWVYKPLSNQIAFLKIKNGMTQQLLRSMSKNKQTQDQITQKRQLCDEIECELCRIEDYAVRYANLIYKNEEYMRKRKGMQGILSNYGIKIVMESSQISIPNIRDITPLEIDALHEQLDTLMQLPAKAIRECLALYHEQEMKKSTENLSEGGCIQ